MTFDLTDIRSHIMMTLMGWSGDRGMNSIEESPHFIEQDAG